MNLNELFKPQEKLDKKIIDKHNLQDENLKDKKALAFIVELGEASNEGRWFKFWSNDQKARTYNLLEEYIDTIHFVITLAMEYGYKSHDYVKTKDVDLTTRTLDIAYLVSSLRFMDKSRHSMLSLIFNNLIDLGYQFGFNEEQVISAYHDKNKVNHTRQETGY